MIATADAQKAWNQPFLLGQSICQSNTGGICLFSVCLQRFCLCQQFLLLSPELLELLAQVFGNAKLLLKLLLNLALPPCCHRLRRLRCRVRRLRRLRGLHRLRCRLRCHLRRRRCPRNCRR